jgi:NADH-quinone oxidoreductase subunit M
MNAFWPALVLGAIGAAVPRGASAKHRAGYALVTFFLVLGVGWLLSAAPPEAAERAAEEAPAGWPHLLNLLVGLPLAGAVAVMFLPRQSVRLVRGASYALFATVFALSLVLLAEPMGPGFHHNYAVDWIASLGIRWHVAVDGLSLWLVLLTTLTTPIAAFSSFGSIKTRQKELAVAYLLLEGAMLGAFVALDLFQFYVFFELMLVPMFLMIGIWGGAEKIKAAIKLFVFTMTGSVLMLAALVYLAWTHQKLTGRWSFDYLDLMYVVLPRPRDALFGAAGLCFGAFALAFFIKVPMFPFHTWLPDAHVQAPTGGSVVLAALMLKFGTYGYLRFAMGLFPGVAAQPPVASTLAAFAILGGILWGALCAWKQSDVKKLVAYSSVAHLGFVMLGLFGATRTGIQGAILQMVNHGLATGALFLLVGVIYDRRHTREVSELGGIAKVMPAYAAVFIVVTMASVGVPGTGGFIGELMIIAGTYVPETRMGDFAGVHAVGAVAGVILAAVYMLSVVEKTFFGPLSNPKNRHLEDLSPREGLALAPLVVLLFVTGWLPGILTTRMAPAVATFDRFYTTAFESTKQFSTGASLLPERVVPEAWQAAAPWRKKAEEPKPADAKAQAGTDKGTGAGT